MRVDLAVIIITKNEEARIRECIDACLEATANAMSLGVIHTSEVVLVDSASTDQTVNIALSVPITVVQLAADWPLSAAAGRFVGLRNTDSDLVLFVDGDYVLFSDWLPSAIEAIRAAENIAAISGQGIEESTGNSLLMQFSKMSTESLLGEPEAVPVGLYRRDALESVGGIHPFLKGAEDRELAHRLRGAGYRLVRIASTMGRHRWAEHGTLDFITYFRSVLAWSIGDGQTFRLRRQFRETGHQTRERYANARHLISYLVGLLLGAMVLTNTIPFVLRGYASVGVAVADVAALGFLAVVRRARGWTWRQLIFQMHSVPYSVVRHGGFLIGVLRPVRAPSAFPVGERVLKQTIGRPHDRLASPERIR